MNNVEIIKHPGDVIEIKNIFSKSLEFISEIEKYDDDENIKLVIPKWQVWMDGYPKTNDEHVPTDERGSVKYFDWNKSENNYNSYTKSHEMSLPIIKLIEEDYFKALKIWSEETNNPFPDYITKNYCVRKYKTGGYMNAHIDKNKNNPSSTMDWTALVYLNDDYEGGDLVFDDLGYSIKPTSGSVVFLPCETVHSVKEVVSGNKYYLFFFIYLKQNATTGLGEGLSDIRMPLEKLDSI